MRTLDIPPRVSVFDGLLAEAERRGPFAALEAICRRLPALSPDAASAAILMDREV